MCIALWILPPEVIKIHCAEKVYAVLPVSTVKCLCSGGQEATLTSISIFDFFDIKALWFGSGNYIYTGYVYVPEGGNEESHSH